MGQQPCKRVKIVLVVMSWIRGVRSVIGVKSSDRRAIGVLVGSEGIFGTRVMNSLVLLATDLLDRFA